MIRTAIALIFVAAPASAQSIAERSQIDMAPKTKLEAFNGSSGAVIIKEYTDTGTVRSTGAVTVQAVTFRNAGTGAESKGLVIEAKQPTSYSSRDARSFIDYDEISGMLEGIDYIASADLSMVKLANFEATYRTRGDVRIVVFNQGGSAKNAVAIEVGRISSATAFLKIKELPKLRELIVAAKNILDNPNSLAAKGDRGSSKPAAPAVTIAPAPPPQTSNAAPPPAVKRAVSAPDKKKPTVEEQVSPFPKPR